MRMCKGYLQDKAKYLSLCKLVEAGNAKKVEHPIGSKKAKQVEEDKKLIESALKDAGCVIEGGKEVEPCSSSMDKIVGMLESHGKSILDCCSREEESEFMSLLDIPDLKCLLKEKLKSHLAAECAQWHQHETLLADVVVSDTLASSSSGCISASS
jgi:hypothetical protein